MPKMIKKLMILLRLWRNLGRFFSGTAQAPSIEPAQSDKTG